MPIYIPTIDDVERSRAQAQLDATIAWAHSRHDCADHAAADEAGRARSVALAKRMRVSVARIEAAELALMLRELKARNAGS